MSRLRFWFTLAAAQIVASPAITPTGIAPPAVAQDLPTVYHGPSPPNAEFDAASVVRILPGGDVLEIAGSFSATVPATLTAVLAQAPTTIRTVRLESPGGNVKGALAVARIIRDHDLDTYVGRLCASACTLAFLGGHHRFLAASARLGFHQAYIPGMPPERFDPILRTAYEKFAVPPAFIDHVLHTGPQSIWFPSRDELRDAGFTTGPPPDQVAVTDDPVSVNWAASLKQLRWASNETLVRFAGVLSTLLSQLQTRGRQVCWDFMHGVPTDLNSMVAPQTLQSMTALLQQVRDDVANAPAIGTENAERARLLATLVNSLPVPVRDNALEALRPDEGANRPYCQSMRALVDAALELPEPTRGPTLRALLSGG
jgi:hypothetical protein